MRFLSVLTILAAVMVLSISPAQASPKPWGWSWWPTHWSGLDFQPYFGGQKISQRALWDQDTWTPEAWVNDAGDAERVLHGFYAAGIVTDQYEDSDNIPVLEVGERFLQLAGIDQRRVLQFIDYVFDITAAEENGMFFVFYEDNDDEPIGIFNKYGFQSY